MIEKGQNNKNIRPNIKWSKINLEDITYKPPYESDDYDSKVVFIGEKAAERYATGEASAQFASFSSYQAYKFVKDYAIDRRALKKKSYIENLDAYKSRGFMLYCGKTNALIFLGNPKQVSPFIYG